LIITTGIAAVMTPCRIQKKEARTRELASGLALGSGAIIVVDFFRRQGFFSL